jgi:hypothetical protein
MFATLFAVASIRRSERLKIPRADSIKSAIPPPNHSAATLVAGLGVIRNMVNEIRFGRNNPWESAGLID